MKIKLFLISMIALISQNTFAESFTLDCTKAGGGLIAISQYPTDPTTFVAMFVNWGKKGNNQLSWVSDKRPDGTLTIFYNNDKQEIIGTVKVKPIKNSDSYEYHYYVGDEKNPTSYCKKI